MQFRELDGNKILCQQEQTVLYWPTCTIVWRSLTFQLPVPRTSMQSIHKSRWYYLWRLVGKYLHSCEVGEEHDMHHSHLHLHVEYWKIWQSLNKWLKYRKENCNNKCEIITILFIFMISFVLDDLKLFSIRNSELYLLTQFVWDSTYIFNENHFWILNTF